MECILYIMIVLFENYNINKYLSIINNTEKVFKI